MATRLRIAAAACVVTSGLLVAGAGAALAFADPDAGQAGESAGSSAPSTGAGTATPSEPTTPASGAGATGAATQTVTAPMPTMQLGDGRNGLAAGGSTASTGFSSSSKLSEASGSASSETASPTAGESAAAARETAAAEATTADTTAVSTTAETTTSIPTTTQTSTTTTTTTTTTGPPAPPDGSGVGWHWPWCWGLPPGQPSVGGSSGNGAGTSIGKPPVGVGVPQAPPLMQLPAVVPPPLPVLPVDPVADVIGGLATVAAELPFGPLTLPAIVPGNGAGGGGGAGGGAAGRGAGPRPGTPSAPRTPGGSSQNRVEPSNPGRPNPSAFGPSNGAMPASYRAGYGEYLRAAGVGQMAAVAVPGVTGILVLTGAGGLVGYRQARAGHTLRANGTARFMG